ncbi:MAG: HAD-IIIA family hydrolase [Prevotellaceae bacterium]|nr:HAD-IIIA family hydrolase [Prevotellaceae bacterium]
MKTIIFDLDGTLLDTLTDLAASTNHALKQHNYPCHTIEEIRLMVGNGVAKLIERALPPHHTAEQFEKCFATFKQHYSAHCLDNTKPYPQITQLLKTLYQHGIATAIVTNKLQSAANCLTEQFFKPYISVTLGDCPQYKRKPAPDMLLEAMKQTHALPSETIYVGDSEVDIQAAKAAQVECLSALWGFRDKAFLLKHGAKNFVETPLQIINYINI